MNTVAMDISTSRKLQLIGKGVFLESIRRKEIHVVLMFAAIYVIALIVSSLVGIENKATGAFLLNLGLAFAFLASHLVAIVSSARQIPNEIEGRTIHPILAKPISRGEYLMGKWIASSVLSLMVFVLLLIASGLISLFIPLPDNLSPLLFIQATLFNCLSLFVTCALVLALSLVIPKVLNMVLSGALIFLGPSFIGILKSAATGNNALDWLIGYIPNFGRMHLYNQFTDALGPMEVLPFFAVIIYGLLLIFGFLGISQILFERRAI